MKIRLLGEGLPARNDEALLLPPAAHGGGECGEVEAAGLAYDQLLPRIINYGLAWRPERRG